MPLKVMHVRLFGSNFGVDSVGAASRRRCPLTACLLSSQGGGCRAEGTLLLLSHIPKLAGEEGSLHLCQRTLSKPSPKSWVKDAVNQRAASGGTFPRHPLGPAALHLHPHSPRPRALLLPQKPSLGSRRARHSVFLIFLATALLLGCVANEINTPLYNVITAIRQSLPQRDKVHTAATKIWTC